ncbi:LytTR family DNA-binding domain-containing protein [Flavobacteriaceae bacterium S356]|uniref:LytTR family DNA-binding domain-containing protein n=1 Tax=Asprobacillus argus TaxID=3076534 RepID=A0ABU3LE24_9FLAO|nr:LytTR family DNA-binding domain-containing protein [Flavobacteriaceae bacterium S356]
MSKLTAVLIDDMLSALEMLKSDLLLYFPEIEIIGTAKSVVEGAKLLQTHKPDILFLDIMLGDGTGFDILEIVPNLHSKIIFVTASDEYAIKAFKFAAIDYVLKPYSKEDLETAISKAKRQITPGKEQLEVLKNTVAYPSQKPKKISLNTLDKIIVVGLNEIIRCKSDNNYTQFFFENGTKLLVTKTLKYYADMLKEYHFLRVHQSHLINTQYIKEYIKSDGGYLMLKDNSSIPVSVRKRPEVFDAIKRL